MTEKENAKARERLVRQLDRDLFAKGRVKLTELRGHIKHAKSWRRTRLPEVRIMCKRNRLIAVERARAARAAIAAEARIAKHAATQAIRLAARAACESRKDQAKARGLDATARAQQRFHDEKVFQAQVKRASKPVKLAPGAGRKRAAERARESDDEVRNNTERELWPVWEKVKHKFKDTPRMTRTEAFAHWMHDHPADVEKILYADHDDSIKDLIKAEAEQRAHLHQPAAKRAKVPRLKRALAAEPFTPAPEVEPWDEPAAPDAGPLDWDDQVNEAEAVLDWDDQRPLEDGDMLLFFPTAAARSTFEDLAGAHRGRGAILGRDLRAEESHARNSQWLLWAPPEETINSKAYLAALSKTRGLQVAPAIEIPATIEKVALLPHAMRLAPLRAVGLMAYAPQVGWPEANKPQTTAAELREQQRDAMYEQIENRHRSINQDLDRQAQAAYLARTPKKKQRADAAERKREAATFAKRQAATARLEARTAKVSAARMAKEAARDARAAERAARLDAARRKKGAAAYSPRETPATPGSTLDVKQTAARAQADAWRAADLAEGHAAAVEYMRRSGGMIAIHNAPKGETPAFYVGWKNASKAARDERKAAREAKQQDKREREARSMERAAKATHRAKRDALAQAELARRTQAGRGQTDAQMAAEGWA